MKNCRKHFNHTERSNIVSDANMWPVDVCSNKILITVDDGFTVKSLEKQCKHNASE